MPADTLRTDLVVRLDFEQDGTLKSLITDAQADEAEAAKHIVPALLKAARDPLAPFSAKPAKNGPRLFAEIDKWLEEQIRGGAWIAQSALDFKGDFEQFKAILGDIPVAAINLIAQPLRDTLLRLPANMNKLRETKGKSIEEILALELPPQSAVTVRKKWGRLISFCAWLEGKGLLDRNYAAGKKPKAKAQSYEKFSKTDLIALFESEEYRSGSFTEPFQYWLPLLGLYTGARLEELAQLHLADIKEDPETGVLVFEITAETDAESGAATTKNLKNGTTARTCPVHSAVMDAGLLAYVEALRSAGYDRLFPELALDGVGKVAPRASEWFTEYRRSKGVGDLTGRSSKVFHSFRHTMNATLQKGGIPQEIREALSGHVSKAINIRIYGGTLLVRALKDSLEKLDYGLTLTAFKSTLMHENARRRAIRRSSPKLDNQ